jgi:transcriptional regulator with XRE-family HTH domain
MFGQGQLDSLEHSCLNRQQLSNVLSKIMAAITIQTLGRMLAARRGERGVRAVAKEIGISHGTLSRVERGYMPDLETFSKICKWLDIDAGEVLGCNPPQEPTAPNVSVHFRKDQALPPKTAQALANMILAAQRAMIAAEKEK